MQKQSKQKTKQRVSRFDHHAGKQLYIKRSLAGMTQVKLAEQVGLTFQQIQKYEKGTNRISAGVLYKFSCILEVPMDYFAEGFDEERQTHNDFLLDKKSLRFLRKYHILTKKNPDFPQIMNDFFNMFQKL